MGPVKNPEASLPIKATVATVKGAGQTFKGTAKKRDGSPSVETVDARGLSRVHKRGADVPGRDWRINTNDHSLVTSRREWVAMRREQNAKAGSEQPRLMRNAELASTKKLPQRRRLIARHEFGLGNDRVDSEQARLRVTKEHHGSGELDISFEKSPLANAIFAFTTVAARLRRF